MRTVPRRRSGGGAVTYYLLYFFQGRCLLSPKGLLAQARNWLVYSCPFCKSREVILQGYQGYKSVPAKRIEPFFLCEPVIITECRNLCPVLTSQN